MTAIGRCAGADCGRLLTAEKSLRAGLGPVCRRRLLTAQRDALALRLASLAEDARTMPEPAAAALVAALDAWQVTR